MWALPHASDVQLKALRSKGLVREIDHQAAPFGRAFAAFLDRERRKQQAAQSETITPTGDLTGKTLGAYRVLEPLGRGGMAEVYKGYHPLLDRYVALKVLHAHFSADAQFQERFQREAASVARLRHVNIVQVHDFGLQDSVTFMAMEYIQGITLKERLIGLRTSGRKMPISEAATIVRELAAALDHAHEHGLIHRDVKAREYFAARWRG